ncbi:MAG: hypothetical protein KF685_01385 [Acidobacteria bacterium]|nr:hypothetical protein [Acidobacteriota bacterium]
MINKSTILKTLTLTLATMGFVLLAGELTSASAQTRDPFAKPGWARTREAPRGGTGSTGSSGPKEPANVGAPPIEQRISYYMQMREAAAAEGRALPKVTSVLTLNEMAVTGIFKSPRGYAAIVEATPIKLSYTIYPGEKFFDGQLVAVEENRLVFRKVTKMSNGKFVSSVENKPLRQYSDQARIQGTAPEGSPSAATSAPQQAAQGEVPKVATGPILSPLDEMNRQPAETEKAPAKRPVRVARGKN